MKKLYEYAVVNKKDNSILEMCQTRAESREEKKWYKECAGLDVKIEQRLYKLETVKVIR